jgi:probable rRNA maturation factor
VKIRVHNSQKDLKISAHSVKQALCAALSFKKVLCHEAAVHLVTQRRISKLHGIYFNDPTPTDCISFPLDKPNEGDDIFLGEIFISPRAAIEYVAKEKGNVYEEVTLYLIHGLLHLLGYDDMQEANQKHMRKEEQRLLDYLRTSHHLISP